MIRFIGDEIWWDGYLVAKLIPQMGPPNLFSRGKVNVPESKLDEFRQWLERQERKAWR